MNSFFENSNEFKCNGCYSLPVYSEEFFANLQKFLFSCGIGWRDSGITTLSSSRGHSILIEKYASTGKFYIIFSESTFSASSRKRSQLNKNLCLLFNNISENNLFRYFDSPKLISMDSQSLLLTKNGYQVVDTDIIDDETLTEYFNSF